jgi:hypothetical protein
MDRWVAIAVLLATVVVPPSDWLASHLGWALLWLVALLVEILALGVVTGNVTFRYFAPPQPRTTTKEDVTDES